MAYSVVKHGSLLVWLLTICSVYISSVSCQDPKLNITYTEPPSVGTVVKGILAKDAVLSCEVENHDVRLQVRWERRLGKPDGSVETTSISVDTMVTDNIKWSIEKPALYTWRLRIRSLQIQDESNYTCLIILSGHNNKVESNRTVLVQDPPAIVQALSTSDSTVSEGDKLEMKCNASGIPEPTLIWRREGNAILPESSGGGVERLGGILDIQKVSYLDRGRYFCRAINERGLARWEVYLIVNFPPKILTDSDRIGQARGYRRTLKCYIEASPPINLEDGSGTLFWSRNDVEIPDEPNKRITRIMRGAYGKITFELRIFAVEEDDYGMYTCFAGNIQGNAEEELELYETDDPQSDDGHISGSGQIDMTIATLITLMIVAFLHI